MTPTCDLNFKEIYAEKFDCSTDNVKYWQELTMLQQKQATRQFSDTWMERHVYQVGVDSSIIARRWPHLQDEVAS